MVVILLWACFTSQNPAQTCNHVVDCQWGELCLDGECVRSSCLVTEDCPLQAYCVDGQCVSGCETDKDCLAGMHCDLETSSCTDSACRNAILDCPLGLLCHQESGACYEDGFLYCQSCGWEAWTGESLVEECVIHSFDAQLTCFWDQASEVGSGCLEDRECFPADGVGNTSSGLCVEAYLSKVCVDDHDCPAGFRCDVDIYGDNSGMNVCAGDCPLYLSQGWLTGG